MPIESQIKTNQILVQQKDQLRLTTDTDPTPTQDKLLLEDGFYFLLEDNFYLLIK